MAQPLPSNDRLPWLTEVPRIGPEAPPKRRWEFPWGAVLIGLAFAFVAVAAYYLGIRKAANPDDPAQTRSVPLDRPYEETLPEPTVGNQVDQPDLATAETPTVTTVEREQPDRPRPVSPRRPTPAPRPAVEPADPSNTVAPAPVIVQPVVRGRIVQLGAYPSQRQAELAWQALVKKWPYLATKPRLVSPIDVRSTDGKATRMHRLQLATASQAQSVVICQQLEKTRQNCVVVY